jgi:selenocysteine lyase/cysteine desulfurase
MNILKFGKQLLNDEYYNDSNFTYTNHGALGRVPKSIIKKYQELQIQLEKSPDLWYRIKSYELFHESKRSLAAYLNLDENNILFCKNVTDGINCILKSIEFDINDAILTTEFTYESILNTIDYVSKYKLEDAKQIKIFKVAIKFPIYNKKKILDEFEETCKLISNEKKLKIRLAVIDHIASSIATIFPVKEINEIIRIFNSEAIILIDGAHTLGQIEININELNCDFYVSNLHKWFLSPRGCGFIYFKNIAVTKNIQPNYISFGYKKSIYLNFKQRASEDMLVWSLVNECIEYFENRLGGLKNISNYCTSLLQKAVDLLTEEWKTNEICLPDDMKAPYMRVIKLPDFKSEIIEPNQLTNYILINYKLISYIVKIETEFYVRISTFVYNDLDDFVKLKNAILELKDQNIKLE